MTKREWMRVFKAINNCKPTPHELFLAKDNLEYIETSLNQTYIWFILVILVPLVTVLAFMLGSGKNANLNFNATSVTHKDHSEQWIV